MITGIGHTAYRVRDLDRSLQFYCGILGFEEAFRLYRDSGETALVYVRVNDETFIELFPGGAEPVEITPRSIAFTHLCLTVDDLDRTLAELRRRGLEVTGQPSKGRAGSLQCWIADPDGNRIELMQLLPDSLHRKSLAELAARRGTQSV